MMSRQRLGFWLRHGFLLACAALSACGGGGGGSGGGETSAATGGTATVARTRETPLEIAAGDAVDVAGLQVNGFAATPGTQISMGMLVRDLAYSGQARATYTCENNGSSVTMQVVDRNNDQRVTPGDQVEVTLKDCVLASQGSTPLNTSFTIDLKPSPTGAAMLALGQAEAWLAIGHAVTEWLDDFAASKQARLDRSCTGAYGTNAQGTLSLVLTDRQGDGQISAGDRVDISLNGCHVEVLGGDALTGTLSVELSTPTTADGRWAATVTLGDGLQVVDDQSAIRLVGQLALSLDTTRLSRKLQVRSTDRALSSTFTAGGQQMTELVTGLEVTKELRRDTARATTTMALRLASDLLGGSVQLGTDTPFSSAWNVMPDAGRVTVTGADGRSVSVGAKAQGGQFLQSTIQGAAGPNLHILSYLDGLFWSGHGFAPVRGVIFLSPAPGDISRPLSGPNELNVPTQGALIWQYPAPPTTLASGPVQLLPRATSSWGLASVPATLTVEGALVTLTPSVRLDPGMTYSISLTDQPRAELPISTIQVVDTVNVTTSFSSEPGRSGVQLLLAGTTPGTVTATASARGGRTIQRVQWRQVSGPAVTFDSPNALTSLVRLTPGTTGEFAGTAVLEVEVETNDQEIDRSQVSVTAIRDAQQISAYGLRLAGTQTQWVKYEVNGPATALKPTGGNWSALVEPWRMGLADLTLLSSAGMSTQVGNTYGLQSFGGTQDWTDGQTRVPYCSSIGGQLRVLQLEPSPALPLRLAVDFTMQCAEGHSIEGWIRINTSHPIPTF